MKRNILLAVIPLVVVIAGFTGGRSLPDGAVYPSGVTYGKMVPVSIDLADYLCVVFHEPVSIKVLPRERMRDVSDIKKKGLMEGGISDMDQAMLNAIQDAEEEEFRQPDKSSKKKVKGLFGQQEDKKGFDDRSSGKEGVSPFKKEIDEGWGGGGWLSDAILSEERRVQNEMNSQLMDVEAEPSVRKGVYEPAPAGAMGSYRASDRLGSAGEPNDGKMAPFKPSFRIESWKPKGK